MAVGHRLFDAPMEIRGVLSMIDAEQHLLKVGHKGLRGPTPRQKQHIVLFMILEKLLARPGASRPRAKVIDAPHAVLLQRDGMSTTRRVEPGALDLATKRSSRWSSDGLDRVIPAKLSRNASTRTAAARMSELSAMFFSFVSLFSFFFLQVGNAARCRSPRRPRRLRSACAMRARERRRDRTMTLLERCHRSVGEKRTQGSCWKFETKVSTAYPRLHCVPIHR